MVGRRISCSLVAAIALAVGVPFAPLPVRAAPGFPLDRAGREQVTFDTADGLKISATYSPAGGKPGAPVVVLVHGEGQTRQAFGPLVDALDEHRVPWLAIDLRGHGASATQDGKDLSSRVKDPAFAAGYADDVYGAVRWLVDSKKHDPKAVGVLGAALGASATLKVASLHPGELLAVMLLTPAYGHPGFDTKADAHALDGKLDVMILASVEDMNRLDKNGPRAVLYLIERDRNAPPDTRREERVLKRRGIPPRVVAFAETNVYGTRMFDTTAGVLHLDAWIAAWWARRLSTLPHAVLWDGIVDRKNDYADPGWDGTTVLPGGENLTANVVRWGTRLMFGGEVPPDTKTIFLRIYATRGDGRAAGHYAQIAYPSGIVSVQALAGGFRGRAPPTETSALVRQPEEIPQQDGSIVYGKPSFEAETRLPELEGDGPLEVRVSYTVSAGDRAPIVPGIDPDKPETWKLVPDQLEGEGSGAPVRGAVPPRDDRPETPDGPIAPKDPSKPR